MLKIVCPDGVDLKFMDDRYLDITVEDGELSVRDMKTREELLHLGPTKWSSFYSEPSTTIITT